MKVLFDVQQLYYVPQYAPVQSELEKRGVLCEYVFYKDVELHAQQLAVASSLGCKIYWVSNQLEARQLYLDIKPNWIVIGNYFDNLEEIHQFSKTALLSHGIGPKSCYYTVSDSNPSVRFVEGPYRTERLQEMYPSSKFVDAGYAKLDPIISGETNARSVKDLGLDPNKPTLLYAPTFYPSSLEVFSKGFPKEFSEYNIILKPHYFSLANPKYKGQKKRLEHWAKFDNVYLAGLDEVNILPFMGLSDLLISDASSTLFEFAALNKPIVWCDFYKLRWSYRGPFKYRFDKRMDQDLYEYADVSAHAGKYKGLKAAVDSQIKNPLEYEAKRKEYTLQLAGTVDGKVSHRIADYMVNN